MKRLYIVLFTVILLSALTPLATTQSQATFSDDEARLETLSPGGPAVDTPLPAGPEDVFPERQFTLRALAEADTLPNEELNFTIEVTYPTPHVIYLEGSLTPGEYVDDCEHLAGENKFRCTGALPARNPIEHLRGYFDFGIKGTCSLYTDPQTDLTFDIEVEWEDGRISENTLTMNVSPPLDVDLGSDSTPADGATGVYIEDENGQGPKLSWSPQGSYVCNTGTDPVNEDIGYSVYLRPKGGQWREVGQYPNCSTEVQLSNTDLACLDNGDPAPYQWDVRSLDLRYAPCKQPESHFYRFTTGACYPVAEIKPKYEKYFLSGVGLNNTYRAEVDWNGTAYASTPSPPYGQVTFDLNGEEQQVTGQEWGAEVQYNMGEDFDASLTGGNNTLTVKAVNAEQLESLEVVHQPLVFYVPDWLLEVALGNFSVDLGQMTVTYGRDLQYPDPAFEARYRVPGWVPYLGGAEMGILDTFAKIDFEVSSNGTGQVGLSGNTGVQLTPENMVGGEVGGRGHVEIGGGKGLDLTQADFWLKIYGKITKEMGIADLVPAIKSAESWPIVGWVVEWFNRRATVEAALGPEVQIQVTFKNKDDRLQFDTGTGTGLIDMTLTLTLRVLDSLKASVYGGAKPQVTVQVPASDPYGYLQQIAIRFKAGVNLVVWVFDETWERGVTCALPGGCTTDQGEDNLLALAAEPSWSLIERDYIKPGYGAFTANRNPEFQTRNSQLAIRNTQIISGLFPLANPALAVREDDHQIMLWVHDDPARPLTRSLDLHAAYWDGSTWLSDTVAVDDALDFSPQVAFDADGDGVAVWERLNTVHVSPSLDLTFVQSLEIATAQWDSAGGAWSAVAPLTQDSLMDTNPKLARGEDGALLALWRTGDGHKVLGSLTHPLTLSYSLWDGEAWLTPTAALGGLAGVVDVDLAVYSATRAALVLAQDADGDLADQRDNELFYATWDGVAWSGLTQLTSDPLTDTAPSLSYDSGGEIDLLWLRGDDLVMSSGWPTQTIQASTALEMARPDSTSGAFLDYELARDPNDNLVLMWQSVDTEGADVTYAVYDRANQSWGADNHLTGDGDLEESLAPAFDGQGTLHLAHNKVTMEWVTETETIEISPTLSVTVTSYLPQPAASHLNHLSYELGRDLAIGPEDIVLSDPNPAPGQSVTVSATVHNLGDFAISGGQVAFYDGDPDAGGVQIGLSQALTSPFRAVTSDTVSILWQVPVDQVSHELWLVVDPADAVAERDETNNRANRAAVQPDLVVPWAYNQASPGELNLTAVLSNGGGLATGQPFSVAFRAQDPVTGTLLGTVLVSGTLEPGAWLSASLSLTDPAGLGTGPSAGSGQVFWAVADAGGAVAEADEENNAGYGPLGVLPDLTLTPFDIRFGDPISITVHNRGVLTASDVNLAVWQENLSGSLALVYSDTLGDLGPGASAAASFSFEQREYRLWAHVDPDNLVAESDESNNRAVRDYTQPTYVYLPVLMRGWPPSTWHDQCVDCPRYFEDVTQRSLAVDADGRPHVAYGGDWLYHAWHDGNTWQIEVVDDSSAVGEYASLALDSLDRPHIAYYDADDFCLRYARWEDSAWLTETVDCEGSRVGWNISLALDGDDRAHVSYVNASFSGTELKYTHWDGSQWQTELLDTGYLVGQHNSLALDTDGRPHLSYNRPGSGSDPDDLIHAYWDGAQWHYETVDTVGYLGATSLALNAATGQIHIAYEGVGETDSSLKHAHWTGSQWQIETIQVQDDSLSGVSLRLDGAGYPRLSYYAQGQSDALRYARWDGSAWHLATVEADLSGLDWDEATSLALDGNGDPHIVYHLANDVLLKYAHWDGAAWQSQVLDQGGEVGLYTSLALDQDGRPHVAYYDEARFELKYAYWDGAAWQIQGVQRGTWTYGIGLPSLALDGAGRPHIAYLYDDLGVFTSIRYAVWDGSAWQIQIVDSSDFPPSMRGGVSLALDSAGRPHLSYFTQEDHRYAHWNGSSWQIETVDSVWAAEPTRTSLALDSQGRPHLAYRDEGLDVLKYAYRDGGGWQVETVDDQGNVGWYGSLALDDADRPHISYQDSGEDDLKYAYWDGSAWQIQVVDSEGRVGYFGSLALDSQDRASISYHDDSNNALKYAHWDGSQWGIETVETGNVGWYTSLVLDSSGTPHVSHQDGYLRDLHYTWWGP